jgi:hypothetical protein
LIWRLLILAAAGALAWLIVDLWERRSVGRSQVVGSGLTLITGPDCRLCPLAVAATDDAGVPVTIVDIGSVDDPSIKSLPTVLVADRSGVVIASRSGRSAISGMPELIAMARGVA